MGQAEAGSGTGDLKNLDSSANLQPEIGRTVVV
jgi:hypothetical protein